MKRLILLLSVVLLSVISLAKSNCIEARIFSPGSKELRAQKITLSNGVELEYVESGNMSGTCVIFLHGFSDSWHSFGSVMNLMPEKFHVIAISLRGHGNSSKPTTGYQAKDFSNDISLFIKEKKLGACVIAGHSMGGWIAQQFAIDYPEFTKALILIDTDSNFADNPGVPEFLDGILKLKQPVDRTFAREFQQSTLAKPIDSLQLELFIGESLKLPLYVWQGIASELLAADFSKGLQTVDAPTLIFWGSKDAFCLQKDQDNLVKNLRNEKLIVYEGTGHALHWEEPNRFVADLVNFISKL